MPGGAGVAGAGGASGVPGSSAAGGGGRPVRVLVVDDDALVRAGLTMMLDGAPGIAVVGDENILHALRAGASGYLLKDTPPARIAEAVRQVAAGEPILSPRITRRLMDRVAVQAGAYARARTTLATLSPREQDVVAAIGQGRSNTEIATVLDMTLATVKTHVSHILTKLGLDNRTQIALLAHDAGLA
nr:response regulator transcription factor [Actinoplanes siamensis]